ncbi:hypothetical protein GCM10011348_17100 [Marinobacterium nitratireducens]|uniref:Peptidase C39 domain-containing protein n=1 Tax=Marinobacterium nitratireducens TaxID=518897 RepID=A0A917ZEL8_9GAMM|nr:hypothetical protein [Marinobacterium nitratireducens]GGO80439.1 hypothetical protein GCM10011348_17100 [Marinobacterium nitratireducens]
MKKFDTVAQLDEWGCGVACVASLLGISYREAYWYLREEKGEAINRGTPGLEPHHIALALQKWKVKVVMDWEESNDFPNGTIVCVEGSEPYDGCHYILRTPYGWTDPWVNMDTPNEARRAEHIESYPEGTWFLFALIPITG